MKRLLAHLTLGLMPSWPGLTLDLRDALRVLARSSGFTTVAVVSLAIGIGVNTPIFSVVHGVLLEPLPIDRPDELTAVYWSRPTNNLRFLQINTSGWREAGGRPFNSTSILIGITY